MMLKIGKYYIVKSFSSEVNVNDNDIIHVLSKNTEETDEMDGIAWNIYDLDTKYSTYLYERPIHDKDRKWIGITEEEAIARVL